MNTRPADDPAIADSLLAARLFSLNPQKFGGIVLRGPGPVRRPGLLERAQGGVLIVNMAERIAHNIAAHLAQAMDHAEIAMILLDDGLEADEAPPRVLLERAAFQCDVSAVRTLDFEWGDGGGTLRPARAPAKRHSSNAGLSPISIRSS